MSDKLADEKLEAALEAAFAEATRRYQARGFQRRVGFGSKPALISVDLANAWTRPGNPFTCEHVDDQIKKRASAFHGTYLAGYLRAAGVDTILVTGVTASACVRETICDGLADGFRPIAVKEAIGDRVPGAVLWNLFDIDAKFGDVETTERCLQYLDEIGAKELKAKAA